MLAYRGLLPEGMKLDSSISDLDGETLYPFKYGYSTVGVVVGAGSKVDPVWIGRHVFVFHSHESHFVAQPENLIPIPDDMDPEDAVFLSNMETAVSLVMDGAPMMGESVIVTGLGVVGQLLMSLLQCMPLADIVGVDPIQRRCLFVSAQNKSTLANTRALRNIAEASNIDYDLSYETSGSPTALNTLIEVTRYHGRIVVASWYGKKQVSLDLGSRFHRSKVSLYSSQVSQIDPGLLGRWDKKRRMKVALRMVELLRPRRLITHQYGIKEAAAAYKMLDQSSEPLQTLITYK